MKKQNSFKSIVALLLVAVLVLGLVASTLTVRVHAASSSEIQSEIDSLKTQAGTIAEKKSELDSQISTKETEKNDALAEKAIIDQEMTITLEEIANTSAQIEQYELLIAEKSEELTEAEAAEATLYEQYEDRIRAMEEGGSVSYLSILFQASSFSDLLDRIDMIQNIAESDQTMMDELAAASADIADARTSLEDSQIEMEAQQTLLEEQKATLATQSAEAQNWIDTLDAESAALLGSYETYEAMEAQLSAQIASAQVEYDEAVAAEEAARKEAERLAAEEAARQEAERLAAEEAARKEAEEAAKQEPVQEPSDAGKNDSNSVDTATNPGDTGTTNEPDTSTEPETPTTPSEPTTPTEPTIPTTPSAPSTGSGMFIAPLSSYYISCAYGYRTHPIYGYQHFHGGVDMAAAEGTPVYATASGTVTTAAYQSANGNYVMISHSDGYASAYLHLSYYTVSAGQYVSQGQVIGYVGSTGNSTGPHLDFRIYLNGATVNPMDYI